MALAQAALLLALISVPLFANPLSSRGFLEDRMVLLRLLGALGWGLLIVRPGRVRGLGLIGSGVGLYFLASSLSAWFSEQPLSALPGAYLRQGGWQTDLGLVGIFLGATTFANRPRLSELAVRALLLGGAASSILALAQFVGLPAPFILPGARAGGFTGGPTFLGSALAVLLPIATVRIRGSHDRSRLALTALLALGLFASGSRAALLAALCALALVGIWRGRGRLVLKCAAVLLGLAALFSLPYVRTRLPDDALPNRLISERLGDQIRTRGLLYRDALSAIAHQGARLLCGRGPDTIGNRFSSEVTQDLAHHLGGKLRVDRLHSDPLDLIYTRGMLAALGLILLVISGLRVGRQAARAPPAPDTALTIGLAASLLANFIDGALSVPGADSRLLLFFAAGWLAGRVTGESRTTEQPPELRPGTLGLLTAAGLAVVLFGVGDLQQTWPALPLLALLWTPSGKLRALLAALALLLPFLALHLALDPSGARVYSLSGPEAYADRARLDLLLLLLTLLAAVIGLALVRLRADSPTVRAGPVVSVASALSVLAVLFFLNLAWNDARRLLADVNARTALDLQLGGADPAAAAELLEQALLLAPEVAEYRKLAMLAYTDEAHGQLGRDPAGLRDRVGVHLARILADHPNDAYSLAQSARCLIEFGRLLPTQAEGLNSMALEISERALARAPFATPVLHVTAEVLIVRGQTERAKQLLDLALLVDRHEFRGLLLRGRALAAENDLTGASHFYGLANDAGLGKNECLAALIIAAGATDRIEDAAALAMLLANRVPASPRLDLDVEGARPLLRHLGNDRFKELFDHAERIYQGAPDNLARVRRLLDY